jgi:hypothetical protein
VVVPDRQLSLAIGKEGQNARLAARLAGWRLDIKGMTEWEQIKEQRQKEKERLEQLGAQQAAEEARAAAVAEAEAILEADAAGVKQPVADVSAETAVAEPKAVVVEAIEPVAAPPVEVIDEDLLLEALIQEEESAAAEAQTEEPVLGLSVDELESFTLDEVVEEEEEVEEGAEEILPETSILTPDAGKIRFAEDIVEDIRGGGRRGGGRARRGGGGSRRR